MKNKERKTLQDKWEDFWDWVEECHSKRPILTMFLTGTIGTVAVLAGAILILLLLALIMTLHWAIVVFIVFPVCVGVYFALKEIADN